MSDTSAEFRKTRIAMLIDGDNAQPSLLEQMIAEAGKYGLITIRRIYGDWTTANMNSWKESLNTHAIQPVQQFRYTVGKNATDSSMIIDAMDILYEGTVNGFCLVSSDSDYTRLATRIREKGVFVMGIGKQTTPKAFVNACEVFVYTEILLPNVGTKAQPRSPKKKGIAEPSLPNPLPLLRNAVDIALQEDGWAFLGAIGNHLRQLDPGFDARNYGYKQLSQLFRSYSKGFEVREESTKGGLTLIYVRPQDK